MGYTGKLCAVSGERGLLSPLKKKHPFHITRHAAARYSERSVSARGIDEELVFVNECTAVQLGQMRRECSRSTRVKMKRGSGYRFLVSRSGMLFVIGPHGAVVTCYNMEEGKV